MSIPQYTDGIYLSNKEEKVSIIGKTFEILRVKKWKKLVELNLMDIIFFSVLFSLKYTQSESFQ